MSTIGDSQKELVQVVLQLINVINSECQSMHTEISRMKKIINEASGNLQETFNGFQHEKELLLKSITGENTDDTSPDSVADNSNYLNKGITALQFEDIIQQMLTHANIRIEIMESLMVELNELFSAYLSDPIDEKLKQIIVTCESEINDIRKRLLLENPVKQSSLENGDVTLF